MVGPGLGVVQSASKTGDRLAGCRLRNFTGRPRKKESTDGDRKKRAKNPSRQGIDGRREEARRALGWQTSIYYDVAGPRDGNGAAKLQSSSRQAKKAPSEGEVSKRAGEQASPNAE